ncbi:MAG: hypothetical protein AAGC57_13845 [Pseudomonadota bacterium]
MAGESTAPEDWRGSKGEAALECLTSLFQEMLQHDGFGEMRVEVRILKRGQKEVIVHFGKQHRFVVDAD